MKILSRTLMVDNEKCIKNSGGDRFNLVLMAAARAREIHRQHAGSSKYEHQHTNITALLEFQAGLIGPEYIRKVR